MKKGVLRNFSKFTGKHVCQSLLLNKVAGLEISKNKFFSEHVWATTSGSLTMIKDGKISVGKETVSM